MAATRVVAINDVYTHLVIPGEFVVDWICECGDYATGCDCVGLRGSNLTWTGPVEELDAAGFTPAGAAMADDGDGPSVHGGE